VIARQIRGGLRAGFDRPRQRRGRIHQQRRQGVLRLLHDPISTAGSGRDPGAVRKADPEAAAQVRFDYRVIVLHPYPALPLRWPLPASRLRDRPQRAQSDVARVLRHDNAASARFRKHQMRAPTGPLCPAFPAQAADDLARGHGRILVLKMLMLPIPKSGSTPCMHVRTESGRAAPTPGPPPATARVRAAPGAGEVGLLRSTRWSPPGSPPRAGSPATWAVWSIPPPRRPEPRLAPPPPPRIAGLTYQLRCLDRLVGDRHGGCTIALQPFGIGPDGIEVAAEVGGISPRLRQCFRRRLRLDRDDPAALGLDQQIEPGDRSRNAAAPDAATACRFGLGLLARRTIGSIDQFEADESQQRP